MTSGPSAAPTAVAAGTERIAIAGNPNCGKTTIFNALTGLRQKVGNYPGVTVERREGRLLGTKIVLLDLPGVYALSARSPDEEVARDALLGRIEGVPRPDGVLLVIDASNLERNLYLASQIIEFGTPVVIACNMVDVAEDHGVHVDCDVLAAKLGVPVIATVAHRGEGIGALREALGAISQYVPPPRAWRLTDAFERAVGLAAVVMKEAGRTPPHAVHGGALLWLSDYLSGEAPCRESAERFLSRLCPEHAEELKAIARELEASNDDAAAAAIEARYAWISKLAADAMTTAPSSAGGLAKGASMSDRLDAVLTHRVLGLLTFAVLAFFLFVLIFSGAEPLMALIETGQEAVSRWVEAAMPAGPLRSLLTDGVIAGVGAVVIFVPQICLLFVMLAALEDSGYMARAAFLMDGLMSRVGLAGKSFIPLLSCYACAVPGIMATRTIADRRDRFTTILIAPLMSCSARLPVYLILISAVFGDRILLKAGVLCGIYVCGTVAALLMGLILKKSVFAGPRPTFIMELPPYHVPRIGQVLRMTWDRTSVFLTHAGTIIFVACVLIWALSYFPRLTAADLSDAARARLAEAAQAKPAESVDEDSVGSFGADSGGVVEAGPSACAGDGDVRENLLAAEQLRHSYIGRLGRAIEPAIRPLGYDWRLGVGMLSSFLAREVFVSTMGVTFAVGEADEQSTALRDRLAAATWPDGRKVLTPLVGVSVIVFYMLSCQCVSTLAVVRRETNSWRWPAFLFAYMTGLAYVASLAVHQVGSRIL